MSPSIAPYRFLLGGVTLAVTLAACDVVADEPVASESNVSPGRATTPSPLVDLRIPAADTPVGDFVYDLAPLPVGGVFRARLDFADGAAAELHSTGSPEGTAIALVVDGLDPDSVTVSYLAEGTDVAPPITYHRAFNASAKTEGTPDARYEAGTAQSEPDSYHYKEVDGEIVVVKDFNDGTARTAGTLGILFETARGERVRVTDVAFTLYGVDAAAPEATTFESPSAFALQWFDLGS